MMSGTFARYLRYTSWPIIAAMVTLMAWGVTAIHVSEQNDPSIAGFANKQMIFACVALVAFVAATLVSYPRLGQAAYALFALTLLLLVVVLFLPARGGARRWIFLGPIQAQPSEVAKLTYILMLAWYLRYRDNYRRLMGLIVPFVLTFVPLGLILIEPDLGTSLLFLPTLYLMLFAAGAKLRHLLGIVAVATAVVLLPVPVKLAASAPRPSLAYAVVSVGGQRYAISAASLAVMEPHQLSRIEGWLHQSNLRDTEKGYQLAQSKMILGAGRWIGGRDWSEGEIFFQMLPEDHTDFIFAVLGGQWGFLGCLGVLLLYGVIFLFGAEIAVITSDPFGRLLAVGVLALLFSQIVINVGMTMGLMPVTGMTLPMMSYGGSSLVVNGAALGLLVNVGQRRPINLGPKPFEYDDTE
ncbi:MAG: FtsW/RodA/SpoVE family cell cycle protein [Phycisphaerae bacterium]|jgi:rod shape-determining protein RodA